ncbi:hypothetical protein [Nocardioides sp.]|uniref:hypothetical protein n=1 Tax=Nocardioides sp. TaxID=35761 RepID=UPI00262C8C21|nr:hypothetical protein [Nocardioides sp.]MDI6912211.1 hypothetical protein [Nocardioides sp.]
MRCRYAGLIFPDGRRCCYYHATEADERLVDELDARAPGIGLVRDGRGDWGCTFGWPYGPNLYMATRQRLLEWAEPLGLRRSLRGHACRAWLTTGRRCYGACRTDDQVAGWPVAPGTASDLNPMPLSWPDHISTWTRDGEPAVIVAQPYHLDDVDYAHLGVIAADPAVRLEALPPGRSWYGARTYFLAVWRA